MGDVWLGVSILVRVSVIVIVSWKGTCIPSMVGVKLSGVMPEGDARTSDLATGLNLSFRDDQDGAFSFVSAP